MVFAVAWRESLIRPDFTEELQKYITGIVRKKNQKLIEINCMPDHIHILIGLKPSISLSDLMRDVKSDSTEFIKRKGWIRGRFNWQEGFGAFSYSHSHLDLVIRYIRNQEEHHAKRSLRNEYLRLLKRFDIAYEPKYLFEFFSDDKCMALLTEGGASPCGFYKHCPPDGGRGASPSILGQMRTGRTNNAFGYPELTPN